MKEFKSCFREPCEDSLQASLALNEQGECVAFSTLEGQLHKGVSCPNALTVNTSIEHGLETCESFEISFAVITEERLQPEL